MKILMCLQMTLISCSRYWSLFVFGFDESLNLCNNYFDKINVPKQIMKESMYLSCIVSIRFSSVSSFFIHYTPPKMKLGLWCCLRQSLPAKNAKPNSPNERQNLWCGEHPFLQRYIRMLMPFTCQNSANEGRATIWLAERRTETGSTGTVTVGQVKQRLHHTSSYKIIASSFTFNVSAKVRHRFLILAIIKNAPSDFQVCEVTKTLGGGWWIKG